AVREAALAYIGDASTASDKEVHHEVDGLLRAADRAVHARKHKDAACDKVAALIERLSERTRRLLSDWGELPDPKALRDPATQCAACAVREAALAYIGDASTASDNEVHHEVDGLLRAADRAVHARKHKDAAC